MSIKASDFTLNHLIGPSEKTGEKWKDLNLVLASADAWGLLRKDLITALGVQRAKKFLLRYGYNCGAHEARMLKEAINWESDLDWLIAGTKMHHLTGRALSYTHHFEVDMEKGIFNNSGYWIDSYEAKQHLHYFSKHSEPICYFLIGYGSGYTSECMGKQVIFKEIKCKGKGDDYCSYVAKTIKEWGEEIEEELLYYEDDEMSGELDQMYRRVEQQKERLEIGYSLSHSLNHALLEGEGLTSFAKILSKSIHCQVIIEDKNFNEISSFGITPGMDRYVTAKNTWMANEEASSIHTIIETELQVKTFNLVTTPIVVRKQIHGFLTMALDQKIDSFYKDLLERTANVASLYIQNERVVIETEQRLKGELLEQLLNSKEINSHEIINRFSYLGYNLTNPHFVLHVEMENEDAYIDTNFDNDEQINVRNKLNSFYQDQNKYGSHMLVLTKWNTIQAIISKQFVDNKGMSIKNFGEQLLKQLESETQISMGISNETKELSDFYKRAKEAKQAAEIAKIRNGPSNVILASELGHLSLFLYAREPEELEIFAKEKLYSVIEYDQMKKSELLQTLFYYSHNEFNLHKTARVMSISISGMRYRLRKIEELLQTNLSNSNTRFEVQLSLQILLMLGKLEVSFNS